MVMRKALAFILVVFLAVSSAAAKVTPILSVQPRFTYSTFPLLGTTAGQVKGNEVSGWHERYQDLYRRYYDQTGLLDVGLKIEDEHFGLVFDLDFRRAFDSYLEKKSLSNIPFVGNTLDAILDLNFPRVGFAEVKFNKLYASLGRRQVKWGPADYDMAINNSAPYIDNAWLDYTTPAGSGELWFSFMAASFNSAVLNDSPGSGLKNLFAHRLGWANSFFRISFGELNLVYDEMPNLLDLTPLGIWHNLYQDKKSNVMLSLAAEGLITTESLGDLRLYGTFAMDDFDLPHEIASPNGKPAAMGFNAGFQYHALDSRPQSRSVFDFNDYTLSEKSFRFDNGLNFTYEFYFVTPYMYNRSTDNGKFTIPMRTFTFGHGYVDDSNAFFLGFPYGPNSMLHRLNVEYCEESWTACLTAEFLQRGSYGIDSLYGLVDQPDYMDFRFKLRGEITNVLLLTAGGSWYWKPGFCLDGSFSGTFDLAHDKSALSATIGVSINVPEFSKALK